ncbi:hypothetical protein ACFQMM_16835 [Saliphagus sp. GCM10025308]
MVDQRELEFAGRFDPFLVGLEIGFGCGGRVVVPPNLPGVGEVGNALARELRRPIGSGFVGRPDGDLERGLAPAEAIAPRPNRRFVRQVVAQQVVLAGDRLFGLEETVSGNQSSRTSSSRQRPFSSRAYPGMDSASGWPSTGAR